MLPDINLDTERFKEIVEEAKSKISSLYPEWTDYNYHDPGITFIELFAWLKEIQQFYINQTGIKNKESYFRVLGIKRRHRTPAIARVKVKAERDCLIEKGRRLYAGDIPFETTTENMIIEGDIKNCIIQGSKNSKVIQKHQMERKGELHEYLFGEKVIPGNSFYIGFSKMLPQNTTLRIFINTEEEYEVVRNPIGNFDVIPLAKLSYEYFTKEGWSAFSLIKDETYCLMQDGSISFSLSESMEQCEIEGEEGYFIKISVIKSEYDMPPVLTGISINMLEVIQTETRREEYLYLGEADGLPNQQYDMKEDKIEYETLQIKIADKENPKGFREWEKVTDFYHSKVTDPHYMFEEETGILRFGDGQHGLPPEGSIRITHSVRTYGSKGNVKSGKIDFIERGEGLEVQNEEDAKNGMDLERIEDALNRFRSELKNSKRLITAEDYENMVKQTPGLMIHHCKVQKQSSEPNLVEIIVKPYTYHKKSKLSGAYVNNIMKFLHDKRIIGTKIKICSPFYVNVSLYAQVSINPYYIGAKEQVESTVREFFKERTREFGEPVSYCILYGLMDSLECVSGVEFLTIDAKGGRTSKSSQGDLLLPPDGQAVLEEIRFDFLF